MQPLGPSLYFESLREYHPLREEHRIASSSPKRIAVIGGGVAGLVSAKVLKEDGFDVTVFEKESTVGGVWAESRAYPGLRTNNPRETYAFSDFDYPPTTEAFPTAQQVRGYLKAYADRFGLTRRIHLNTEVRLLARAKPKPEGGHPGFRVTVRPVDGHGDPRTNDPKTHVVDFAVVCNGVFCEPYVPEVEGEERFQGQVLHSSQLTDPQRVRGRRVVVVGAGKSALDCATFAAEEASSVTLVLRRPHWMLPRYFGSARVDDALFNRFSLQAFPPYYNATRTERTFRKAAAPLFWVWRKAVSLIARRVAKVPAEMVPDIPVTAGIENNGIGTEFYEVLRNGQARIRRAGVASFAGPDRLRLDTGEELGGDIVVFGTGWRQNVSFLDSDLHRVVWRDGWFHLYRHILPPREPRLGFVGYASSGNAPLTSEISAHWLSQWFRGESSLPDPSDMDREIARVRRWTQKVFPRRCEGYFIGAYVSSYVDELMRDMGLETRRADGFFSEYLGPLWGTRYRGVAEERRRLRSSSR